MTTLRHWMPVVALACYCPAAFADLTVEQKVSDFTQLAALYARNYGPYEAKREVYGVDVFDTKPWLDKIRASKTDLEFYDLCAKYVASFRDSHDEFLMLSTYRATLPITVDVYDGKVLIDSINRVRAPLIQFPFRVGDELVSIDGKPMADWLAELDPFAVNGASNPVSRARIAAAMAVDRYQGWWPSAPLSVGDRTKASLVVRRQSGDVENYEVDWLFRGTPILGAGTIPSSVSAIRSRGAAQEQQPAPLPAPRARKADPEDGLDPNPWGLGLLPPEPVADEVVPAYMEGLRSLTFSLPVDNGGLSPFGGLNPIFNPPAGFRQRLGVRSSDFFVSGTFPVGSRTVGFIRIPTFAPSSTVAAQAQFVAEIQFLQQNTDGLVLDLMANGGGSGCYAQNLVGALTPFQFQGLSFQVRASQQWIASFSSALASAQASNSQQWVRDLYAEYLRQVRQAYTESRGLTGKLPACGPSFDADPQQDASGNVIAYTKPILVLTDNFTLSAAEIFVMMLQDEGRATLFGDITDGGGGNVVEYDAGAYSEGSTRVTQSLIPRKAPVAVPGFPALWYYDGVGIAPDIPAKYPTLQNLLTGGQPFVRSFSDAIAALIDQAAQP